MNTQLKLSATGKLAVVVGLAYAAPALAANIEAVKGGAQVQTQKGVDIVNIVRPNEQGLSHNQYNKYNVSKSGAVLNNALQAGDSQLAGRLNANSNFNGKAAQVILNEVVSKNPSLILGQQEVFGMAADYVLANPNGITYNGGDIINAPRASLVVGQAEVVNGKIDNFKTNGAGSLNVKGALGGVSILDLVAPKVIVNADAKVKAKQAINVVSGSNKVGYNNGKVEVIESALRQAPVLDGQVFGSMNAGAIRIYSTDVRGGQNIKGANLTAEQDVSVHVGGALNVIATDVSAKQVSLNAHNTKIDGVVHSENTSLPNTVEKGTLADNVKYTKQDDKTTQTFQKTNLKASDLLSLNNTGDLNIKGANIDAGSLKVDAENVLANSAITTDATYQNYSRTKGLWHNINTSETRDETAHRTQINVGENAVINAKNTLTLQGVALDAGKNVKLSGTNGVNLGGQVVNDRTENMVDMRNETAKLKTGVAAQATSSQEFVGTEIKAGGNFGLQSAKTVKTDGAKVDVKGSAIVDADKVLFGAGSSSESSAVTDKVKYWGGIGGGKEDGKTYTQETLQGTSLQAAGDVLIGAKNGVTLSGSTVKGGTNASVNAGAGKLNVESAKTTNSESETSRTGTIFNITKSKLNKSQTTEVVTGSTVASETNLQLVSENDVNVLGSSLQAAENLGIQTAGNLKIATAAAQSHATEESFAIKGFKEGKTDLASSPDKKVAEATGGVGIRFISNSKDTQTTTQVGSQLNGDNIQLNANNNATISGSNVKAENFVNINAKDVTTTAAQNVTKTNESNRVTEIGLKATAGVSNFDPKVSAQLGVSSEFNNTVSTNGTAQVSNVSGGNVNINANKNITHEGTNITATKGDINQNAETIKHDVANNTSEVSKTQHAGGVFIGVEASSSKGLGGSAGIYGKGGTAQGSGNEAVSGSLNATNNVQTNAQTVTDVATNYNVDNEVNINANKYSNEAAASKNTYTANQGGASLTVSAHTKDLNNVNVNAGLNVNYGHLNTQSSNASIGTVNTGSLNINAKEDVNFAANVNSKGDVNINSTEGSVNLTQSNSTTSTTSAGVDVSVNAGATVNVATGVALPKGGAGAEVKYGQSNSSTGVAGTINADGNVNVNANNNADININGASIVSNGSVVLNAGSVNSHALTHSHDSLNVGAGAKFNIGTGMVTEKTEHTVTHLVQDNYCEPPREVTTTVVTEEEKLAVNSVGVGAHADVVKENGVSHTKNQIVAKGNGGENYIKWGDTGMVNIGGTSGTGGLTVNANNANGTGISLTGTDVLAADVKLTAQNGNVDLNSAEGSLKRTGGGAGLNISGSVSQDGFKPTAGNGYVNVDLANNTTHTGSSITANTVNITTPDDVNLNSSTITAQKVDANVGGNVNIVAQQNVVDETKVGLAAAGGKGVDLKSLTKKDEKTQETKVDGGKVAGQILSDLQNGTILGVKAEAKIDVDVEKSKTTQTAGITANTLNANVGGGHVNLQGATVQYENGSGFGNSQVSTADNQDSSKTFTLGVDVGTNVPKMVEYGIQHVTTGTSPLFNTSASSGKAVVVSNQTQTETPVAAAVEVKPTKVVFLDPFTQQPIGSNDNQGSDQDE